MQFSPEGRDHALQAGVLWLRHRMQGPLLLDSGYPLIAAMRNRGLGFLRVRLFAFRYTRRLPRNRLPLAVAQKECAAVTEVADLAVWVAFHQPKRQRSHVTVRPHEYVLGSEYRTGFRLTVGLGFRLFSKRLQDIALAHDFAGRTGVNQIIGPKALVTRRVVVYRRSQKCHQHRGDLATSASRIRRTRIVAICCDHHEQTWQREQQH